jgi:hypothetical protein
MQDGIINKNIRVENIEAKMASTGNMKYILTDSDKNKYFFWQKNKGEDSNVYLSFTGMEVKKGDTVAIGYTEKDESFINREGKTINYTDRFILGLREANGVPTSNSSSRTQSLRGEAPNASQTPSSLGTRNWDREAYEKCCSIWAAASLQRPEMTISGVINGIESGNFYKLFQAIRQSGYEKFEKKETKLPFKDTLQGMMSEKHPEEEAGLLMEASESGRAAFDRGMEKAQGTVVMEEINVEDIPF